MTLEFFFGWLAGVLSALAFAIFVAWMSFPHTAAKFLIGIAVFAAGFSLGRWAV